MGNPCVHHQYCFMSPPPSLCINDSNQRAMIGVVARHPCADALESLPVGFPAKEEVALQGDPSPPPPHPPRSPPSEPCPQALAEMSGHINTVHGMHLFGYLFLPFCMRGPKIEVQIAHQNGMRTQRTSVCTACRAAQHLRCTDAVFLLQPQHQRQFQA
jgi:hypothetical protein